MTPIAYRRNTAQAPVSLVHEAYRKGKRLWRTACGRTVNAELVDIAAAAGRCKRCYGDALTDELRTLGEDAPPLTAEQMEALRVRVYQSVAERDRVGDE